MTRTRASAALRSRIPDRSSAALADRVPASASVLNRLRIVLRHRDKGARGGAERDRFPGIVLTIIAIAQTEIERALGTDALDIGLARSEVLPRTSSGYRSTRSGCP